MTPNMMSHYKFGLLFTRSELIEKLPDYLKNRISKVGVKITTYDSLHKVCEELESSSRADKEVIALYDNGFHFLEHIQSIKVDY